GNGRRPAGSAAATLRPVGRAPDGRQLPQGAGRAVPGADRWAPGLRAEGRGRRRRGRADQLRRVLGGGVPQRPLPRPARFPGGAGLAAAGGIGPGRPVPSLAGGRVRPVRFEGLRRRAAPWPVPYNPPCPALIPATRRPPLMPRFALAVLPCLLLAG